MILCQNCSTSLFDFPSPHAEAIKEIPCDSLAVNLSARVRIVAEMGRNWSKGQGGKNNLADELDDAVACLTKKLSRLKKLQEEYAVASKTLQQKLPYIHLLPLHVLSHIFSFSPEMADEEIEEPATYFRSYANVTTVCKRWRYATVKSAKLWCNIPTINLRTSRWEEDLRRASNFVAKSGSLPLTASFVLVGEESAWDRVECFGYQDSNPEETEEGGDEEMQDVEEDPSPSLAIQEGIGHFIRKIGPRVQHLRLSASAKCVGKLNLFETGGPWDILQSIRLNVYTNTGCQVVFPTASPFQKCPKLNDVTLRLSTRHRIVAKDVPNLAQLMPWGQIADLDCTFFPLDNVIEVLHIAGKMEFLAYIHRPGDHLSSSSSPQMTGHGGHWKTVAHKGIKMLVMGFDWAKEEEIGAADEFLDRLTLPALDDLTISGNACCTLEKLDDFISRSGCTDSLKRFSMCETPASDSDSLPILELLERLTHLSVLHLQTSTQGLKRLLSTLKECTSFLDLRALFIDWQPGLDPNQRNDFAPSSNSYPEIEAAIQDLILERTKPQEWTTPEGVRMSESFRPSDQQPSLHSDSSPCKPLEFLQIEYFRSRSRKFLEAVTQRLDTWHGATLPDVKETRKEIGTILRKMESTIWSRSHPDDRLAENVRAFAYKDVDFETGFFECEYMLIFASSGYHVD